MPPPVRPRRTSVPSTARRAGSRWARPNHPRQLHQPQGDPPVERDRYGGHRLQCALTPRCTTCFNLTATTSCPDGRRAAAAWSGAAGPPAGGGGSGSSVRRKRRGWEPGAGGSGRHGGPSRGAAAPRGAVTPVVPISTAMVCLTAGRRWFKIPGSPARRPAGRRSPGPPPAGHRWTASGNPGSGALAVVNGDTNPADAPYGTTTAGAFQCWGHPWILLSGRHADLDPLGPGERGGRLRARRAHERRLQPAARSRASSHRRSPRPAPGRRSRGRRRAIPLGVGSVAVRLVAVKPVAQASAEALFDNVLVRVTTCASM